MLSVATATEISTTRPQLRVVRPDDPAFDHDTTCDETNTFNYITKSGDGINEPEGGWQIFKTPRHIIIPNNPSNDGIYLLEINLENQDFSLLDTEKVKRLNTELLFLVFQPNVRHIVLSFYRCKNADKLQAQFRTEEQEVTPSNWMNPYKQVPASGTSALVNLLVEADSIMQNKGVTFSIIHNEPNLHKELARTRLTHHIHDNLFDAITNTLPRVPVVTNSNWHPAGHYF